MQVQNGTGPGVRRSKRPLFILIISNDIKIYLENDWQARIQRGDRGSRPPWDLSEVGSCVEAWWVGEGVQRLFSRYYYQFFLARFARQYYTNVLHIHTFKFNIQSSFLYITLILMKRIQLNISCFHERGSSYFSCLKLHDFTPFKTKIYWGGPPDPPPPRHGYNIKLPWHLCACVERDLQLYKRPCPSEKSLYVDNCLESR